MRHVEKDIALQLVQNNNDVLSQAYRNVSVLNQRCEAAQRAVDSSMQVEGEGQVAAGVRTCCVPCCVMRVQLKRTMDCFEHCVLLIDTSVSGWRVMYVNAAWEKTTGALDSHAHVYTTLHTLTPAHVVDPLCGHPCPDVVG